MRDQQKNDNNLSRISMRSIWNDFISMLNFEKGALRTCKGLLLHPRATVEEYLHQDRSKQAHPMRFLLFSTALSTLITYNLALRTMTGENLFEIKNEQFYQLGKKIGEAQKGNMNTVKIDSVNKNIASDTTIHDDSADTTGSPISRRDSLNTDSLTIPLPASTRDSLVLLLDELKFASAKDVILFANRNRKLLHRDKQLQEQLKGMMKPKVLEELTRKIISFNPNYVLEKRSEA